jgi:hypothetical protein
MQRQSPIPGHRPRPSDSMIAAIRIPAACFATLALMVAIGHGQSRADGCAPGWRQYFDFQVGNVFQVRTFVETYPLGSTPNVETIRKYRVVERRDSGSTRSYVFSGKEKKTQSYYGSVQPVRVDSSTYSETRVYRDTVNDPLDGCNGAYVRMPGTWSPFLLYTQVEALTGDTAAFPLAGTGLRMKRYGRRLGTLKDTTLTQIMDIEAMETYAEGLGKVSASGGGYMGGSTQFSLTGYVKGRDTVGTISPDSSFRPTTAIRAPFTRHGAEQSDRISARAALPAFDAQGRREPAQGMRGPACDAPTRFRK